MGCHGRKEEGQGRERAQGEGKVLMFPSKNIFLFQGQKKILQGQKKISFSFLFKTILQTEFEFNSNKV
jgi:hypothetical protein